MKFLLIKKWSVVLLFTAIPLHTIDSQWITGSIDTITYNNTSESVNSPNSIAIDKSKTIHIVFQKKEIESDEQSWRIYYTKKEQNKSWESPIAISDTLNTAVYPSISVTNISRKIFVTFVLINDNFKTDIIVAMKENNLPWIKSNISNDNLDNRYPTIAIDQNEYAHVVWLGVNSLFYPQIMYCSNESGNWITYPLIDNFFGDQYYAIPSISISPNNLIHLIYLDIVNGQFRNVHAQCKIMTNIWNYELLPESINSRGNLKVSNLNQLNFIYNVTLGFQYPFQIYHTFKDVNMTSWSEPQLIADNFDGYCSSFDIDESQHIHLLLDSLELAFKVGKTYYATNKSGSWNLFPVSMTSKIYSNCFILDKSGIGHVIAAQFPLPSELIHIQSANNLIGIESNNIELVGDFSLLQNFPNPFNPTTKIIFNLFSSQFITLTVFDILGKKIDQIVSKKMNPGIHEFIFNGKNLNTGIYFYRIESKKFSLTKKMLLLK